MRKCTPQTDTFGQSEQSFPISVYHRNVFLSFNEIIVATFSLFFLHSFGGSVRFRHPFNAPVIVASRRLTGTVTSCRCATLCWAGRSCVMRVSEERQSPPVIYPTDTSGCVSVSYLHFISSHYNLAQREQTFTMTFLLRYAVSRCPATSGIAFRWLTAVMRRSYRIEKRYSPTSIEEMRNWRLNGARNLIGMDSFLFVSKWMFRIFVDVVYSNF